MTRAGTRSPLFSARRGAAAADVQVEDRAAAPTANPVAAMNLRRLSRADARELGRDVRNSLNGTSFGCTAGWSERLYTRESDENRLTDE
ncbi:hypothetical protein GCM10023094_52110 [Rhodococcus olei]|uniref:Uncharacterized protein n=1 Tax=Rhodococcus olei TaxID=2161675 RepID=A0ABP8PPV0_9NOCA